jgi:hypothetical protein
MASSISAHCYFLIDQATDEALGFYSVNPDANRKKLFTDVYERPGKGLIKDVIAESLKKAAEVHPDYEHLFGVNTRDQVMRAALESFGMEVIRTYWHMKRLLDSGLRPRQTKKTLKSSWFQDSKI